MQKRTLGKSGLEVSAIGFGCMGLNFSYGHALSKDDSISPDPRRRLTAASPSSIRPRSMAHLLTRRSSARRCKPFRNQVVIATKFGFNIVDGKMAGMNSRPEQIRKVCDASLKRLGVEVIDLFYQHRVDPERADRGCRRRRQGADRGRAR